MSKKINNVVLSRNSLAAVMLLWFVQSCLAMYSLATTNTIESIEVAAAIIVLEVFVVGQVLLLALGIEYISNKFKIDLTKGGKK